jgi:DNA-binding transcriptional regulator YiaG
MRQTVTKLQFRRRLRQVGMSQGAFARLVGVDRVTVNRWATGRLAVPQWVGVMLDLMVKAKEKGSLISGHARPPRTS